MNVKIVTLLRESCEFVRAKGIRIIRGGAWFEWSTTTILGADPIGAALIAQGKLPAGLDPLLPETMVRPGLVQASCELLAVDPMWLYRFWMGYDRNFQIMAISEKGQESKDEVSEFGIAMSRELFLG